MTSKKDNTKSGKGSFSDSNELFEALFRSALHNLAKKKQKKAGPKTEGKTDKVITKKPIALEMEARPKTVKPKTEAKIQKAAAQKATPPVAKDTSKHVKPKTEDKAFRVPAKKPIAPAKESTPKKVGPKAEVKMREIILKKPISRVEEEPPKEILPKAEVEKRKAEVEKPIAKAGLEKRKAEVKRPTAQVRETASKEAEPKAEVEKRRAEVRKPVSQVQETTPEETEPKEEARSEKAGVEPVAMPVEYDTAEVELGMEGKSSEATVDEFISELMNDRFLMAALRTYMRFKGAGEGKSISFQEPAAGPSKLMIGLLSGLFVVLVAAGINYFGIVDLGGLIGFSKSTDKKISATHVPNKSPAKADKKQTRVALKSPKKRANLRQPPKTTAQAKAPMVKKTVKKPVKPIPSPKRALRVRKNPIVVNKSARPPTSPKKQTVVKSPPKPAVPKITPPKVIKSPAKPMPSPKKPPTVNKPDKLAAPKQKTLVAKRPLKTTPIVQKKAVSPEKELFPEERASSYPYSVYLGAYRTVERAKKAISLYRKKGLSSYWVKVDLGDKGTWFRVFAGHFRDEQEAVKFIKRKRLTDGKPKKTRYAILIGVYTSKKELKRWSNALSGLGFSSYVIDQPNGESLLYVGAFYTKAGAEKQRAVLASKGIRSRVAMR